MAAATDDAFSQVAQSAGKAAQMVDDIAAASAEQSQGIEQVNQAANEMDRVTQGVAANAEESAASSEELSAQADALQNLVERLMAMVSGDREPAARTDGRPRLPAPGVARAGGAPPEKTGGFDAF
jgi:methyl-accepting chemotaxis protein